MLHILITAAATASSGNVHNCSTNIQTAATNQIVFLNNKS